MAGFIALQINGNYYKGIKRQQKEKKKEKNSPAAVKKRCGETISS